MKNPGLSYTKYERVKTGDVLLFSSWSITSLITKVSTWSEWTHVGIAVWLDTDDGHALYVFEAGIDSEHDALAGGNGGGVRLVNIYQIENRYTKIGVRPVNVVRNTAFYDKLRAFMLEYRGRPFRTSFIRIALMNGGIISPAPSQDGTIICSELVSIYLSRIGATTTEFVQSVPHHQVAPGTLELEIFPPGCFLGPVVLVKNNHLEEPIKMAIFVIEMCSLFLYILLTIDDERRYRRGYRRRR